MAIFLTSHLELMGQIGLLSRGKNMTYLTNLAATTIEYGEMALTGGGPHTIDTTNVWHGYDGFSEGASSPGVTFAAGKTASDITAYATHDAGATTKVTVTAAHGLSAGDIITITGTTNYNDIYEVQEDIDANNFSIDKAWDTNDDATGTYTKPNSFSFNAQSAGDILVQWSFGGSLVAADTMHFGIFHEKTLDHFIPRKFPNNDIGAVAGGGHITVAATDIIWFGVRNTTGVNDVDIDEMTFSVIQL